MKNTGLLQREIIETVDQREIKVPVVWVPQKYSSQRSVEASKGPIWASGQNGSLTKIITSLIDSAKQTAVISSFLLADKAVEDAIEKAASRGVRVYLIIACETHLDNDSPDDDFGSMCLDQHIKMLKRLAGKVMIRSASHYHAKSVLVDAIGPNRKNSRGLLLTANLTTEALERNEELAVELTPSEVNELVAIFKWAFFEYAEHQMLDNHKFESVKPLNEVKRPTGLDHIVITSNMEQSIKDHALRLINQAKHELFISSYGWEEDHEVIKAISDKAKAGTKVKIFARIRPVSINALLQLKQAGADVYGFRWLHAKAIWNDANQAMIMSANLQQHGLDEGFEIGVRLSDERATNIRKSLLGFLNRKHSVLMIDSKLGELNGPVSIWIDSKFKDIVVVKSEEVILDPITAKCATNLEEKQMIPSSPTKHAHQVQYKWHVKAPILPKNAKEIFREVPIDIKSDVGVPTKNRNAKQSNNKVSYFPKTYKTADSKTVIAILNEDELKPAIALRDRSFPSANIVLNTQEG